MPVTRLHCTADRPGVAALDGAPGLAGVMGIQPRDLADATMGPPVTLIRHAYTRPEHQGKGVGTALL